MVCAFVGSLPDLAGEQNRNTVGRHVQAGSIHRHLFGTDRQTGCQSPIRIGGQVNLTLSGTKIHKNDALLVIPGLAPLSEGYAVIGSIAIILAGAFPLVYVLTKVFRKPLVKLGGVLGMNDVAAAGLVASLANSIPMFGMMKDMDKRGKVINVAFAVSAAFVFGDHLGFTAGFAPQILFPVIAAKLTAGITAVLAAMLLTRGMKHE